MRLRDKRGYLAAGVLGAILGLALGYLKNKPTQRPSAKNLTAFLQDTLKKEGVDLDHVLTYNFDNNGKDDYIVLASRGNRGVIISSIDGEISYMADGKLVGRTVSEKVKDFVKWDKLYRGNVTDHKGVETVIRYRVRWDGKERKVLRVLEDGSFRDLAFVTADEIEIIGDIDGDGKKEIVAQNPYWSGFQNGVFIFSYSRPHIRYVADDLLNNQLIAAKHRMLSVLGSRAEARASEMRNVTASYPAEIVNAALLDILTDPRFVFADIDGRDVSPKRLIEQLYGADAAANLLAAVSASSPVAGALGLLVNNYRIAQTYGPSVIGRGEPGSWADAAGAARRPPEKVRVGNTLVDKDIAERYMGPNWTVREDLVDKMREDQRKRNERLREAEQVRQDRKYIQQFPGRLEERARQFQQEAPRRAEQAGREVRERAGDARGAVQEGRKAAGQIVDSYREGFNQLFGGRKK